MIPQVHIYRLRRSDQGTEGLLVSNIFTCRTLELPWRNNQQNISCIPAGDYEVQIRISNKYGRIYWIKNVVNRSFILIHSGNYGGDKSKGFKTHIEGCVLLGKRSGTLGGQVAILNSRVAVRQFMNYMNYEKFNLKIQEAF